MVKRIGCFLAAAAMLLSAAGCGSGKTNAKENGDLPTLVWYIPGDNQPDIASVIDKANAMMAEDVGAKLDIQFIEQSAFTERMNMIMASQSEFDLCFAGYVNPYTSAAQSGGLLDIDEYIEKSPKLKEAVPDYIWEAAKIGGKIYGVPNTQIVGPSKALVVQKQYADKYGLEPEKVKSAKDLEDFLVRLHAGEGDSIFPFRGVKASFMDKTYEDVNGSGGLVYIKTDGSNELVKYGEYPEEKAALDTAIDWYKKGLIRHDAAITTTDYADYLAGKYAVTVCTYKPGVEQEEAAIQGGRELVFIPIDEPYMTTGATVATVTAVSATSKHPEQAIKLIEKLNTDKEFYNLISFGIEGKHYEKIGENRIKTIDGSGYNPDASWKFGKVFNAYLYEGQPDNTWEETERINDECKKSPILGFVPDTSSIELQLSQCASVLSEYKSIDTGAVSEESYIRERQDKLYQAGLQEIYDEISKQITEFLNNK